jgi:hypothetical protein
VPEDEGYDHNKKEEKFDRAKHNFMNMGKILAGPKAGQWTSSGRKKRES